MPDPDLKERMKQSNASIVSAVTSVDKVKKQELHKKTMLKVMDPNVHQLSIGRNKVAAAASDFDVDRVSSLTPNTNVVSFTKGSEP